MRRRRSPEAIGGFVYSLTGESRGTGFYTSRMSAGNFNITFLPGFRLTGAATAISGATRGWALVVSRTDNVLVIQTQNSAGTVADMDFYFVATGVFS